MHGNLSIWKTVWNILETKKGRKHNGQQDHCKRNYFTTKLRLSIDAIHKKQQKIQIML